MYEENRKFSWTNLFIKLIIIAIFVLFVVWLLSLSTKGLNESLNVLTDNIMGTNINQMKEVGREYFTIERLPEKVGDIEKITLREMYDKHLILEIKDKNGKACSAENSYVSVEKLETEYEMKVYLECGDESDYIISIMGCTDLCDEAACEVKEEEEEKKPVNNTVKPTPTKKLEYQYVLKTNGYWGNYGTWSNWVTTKINASDTKQVETKIGNEAYTYTVNVSKIVDYAYNVSKSCPNGYTMSSDGNTCYKNSTTTTAVPTCPSTYNGYTLTSQNGLTCNYKKTTTSYSGLTFVKQTNGSYMPSDTSTYHYEKVSVQDVLNCEDSCKKETIYTYNVYKKNYKTATNTTTSSVSCGTGYTFNSSSNKCVKTTTDYTNVIVTKTCPIGTNDNGTGCYKKISTDEIRTGYKEVTYYRYRTRSYVEGTTTYKWSSSKNDTKLLNAGYKLTGKTRNA